MKKARAISAIRKTPTGIAGFDEMLEGGVMYEFLYRGIERYGEPGLFGADTAHDRAIYRYDIGPGGVVMGQKFEE